MKTPLASRFLMAVTAISLAACGQTRYAMPSATIEGGGVMPSPWADTEIIVEQLTPEILRDKPGYAVRLIHAGTAEELWLPRVPLPAFALTIRNRGTQTIFLGETSAWVSDAVGNRYELLTDRGEIARRAVESVRLEAGIATTDPATAAQLLEPVDAAARGIPILGEAVQIPPGGGWHGAIVLAADAAKLEALRQTLAGGRIVLHVEGARVGQAALPPVALGFVLRASTPRGADCVNEHTQYAGPYTLQSALIDGRAVSTTDISRVLLDRPESRVHERRAWALKVAGWVMVAGGAVGTVGTAGGIGGSGHSSLAPAGLGVLGLSAIGVGLLAGSQREHKLALGEYNRFASRSGLCARPL